MRRLFFGVPVFLIACFLGSAQVELGTRKLRELKLPVIDLSPIGKFAPNLHYEVKPQDVRSFGDLLWYSYVFWIDTPEEHRTGHWMYMCRKDAGGRRRILNMHNSVNEAASVPDWVH